MLFESPAEEWVGQWALRACKEDRSGPVQIDADVVVRGCIAFDLAAGYDELVVGRSDGIYLLLQRCGSDASRLSTVSALSLSADLLVDGRRVRATLGEGESLLKVPFAATESSLKGATQRNVKLQIVELNATYEVLAGSRPVVLEWSKNNSVFDVSLRLPPKTPFVELRACGSIAKNSKKVVCDFQAVASDTVGRVSTNGPIAVANVNLGDVKLDATTTTRFPVEVMPGQPKTFSYSFTLTGTRTNMENINQSFEIKFAYETDGEPQESGVVSGEFVVEPDFGVSPDWVRAICFAFGGLLTALIILVIARWLTARIQVPADGMLWVGIVDSARCDSETVRSAVRSAAIDIAAVPLEAGSFGRREISAIHSIGDCGLTLEARAGWRLLTELGHVSASNSEFHVVGAGGIVNGPMQWKKLAAGRASLSLVGEWWLILRGSVDGVAENSDEVVARLESLPGKVVFIATGSEPPRSFFDDLAFSIAGGVTAGLAAVAERVHVKPGPSGENIARTVASESSAPTI